MPPEAPDVLPSGACRPRPNLGATGIAGAAARARADRPGWSATLAYQLVPDLTTWRLTGPDGAVRFAKVATAGSARYPTLRGESERMVWAAPYLPVPEVVALEQLGRPTILVTEALPGARRHPPRWRADLPALVRALGRGLRPFHDAVGEEWCPFRFDLARALAHVEDRVRSGDVRGTGFHDDTPTSPRRPRWRDWRPRPRTTRTSSSATATSARPTCCSRRAG